MELAFDVDAGPLSQIGVNLPMMGVSVYVAKKVYENYKEKAITLDRRIEEGGTSLAAPSSFNLDRCEDSRRKYGKVWGAARGGTNIFTRVLMPRASTALTGNVGMVSLRHLVVTLLCFVQQDQVYSIIEDLLPLYFLPYEFEDGPRTVAGPLKAAIAEWIRTVDKEEASSDFIKELRSVTDAQIKRVSNVSYGELLAARETNLGLIIKLLRWVLTPSSKRVSFTYPTRSLKVWCVALVLSEIGFEVEASRMAFREPSQMPRGGYAVSGEYRQVPEVTLMLIAGEATDRGTNDIDFIPLRSFVGIDVKEPARSVPFRAYPAMYFAAEVARKNWKSQAYETDAEELENAFIKTFSSIRARMSQHQYIREAANILIDPDAHLITSVHDIRTAHKWLQDLLAELIGNPRGKHIGKDDLMQFGYELLVYPIQEFLFPWLLNHRNEREVMITHLIAASMFGTLSLFMVPIGTPVENPLDLNYIHTDVWVPSRWQTKFKDWWTKLLETLLTMKAVHEHRFHNINLHDMVPFNVERAWGDLLIEALTGGEVSSDPLHPFGAEKHGLVLLLEFLNQPTSKFSSGFVHHTCHGQILDFPLNDGLVIGDSALQSFDDSMVDFDGHLDTEEKIEKYLDLQKPPSDLSTLQMYVEPRWGAVQPCSWITTRFQGIEKLRNSIFDAASARQAYNVRKVSCNALDGHAKCTEQDSILSMMLLPGTAHRWFALPLFEMMQNSQLYVSATKSKGHRYERDAQTSWLVQTYGNDNLLLYALQCRFRSFTDDPVVRIITNCLGTALRQQLLQFRFPVMIILHQGVHTPILLPTARISDHGWEKLMVAARLIDDEAFFGRHLMSDELAQHIGGILIKRRSHRCEDGLKTLLAERSRDDLKYAGILWVLSSLDELVIPNVNEDEVWAPTQVRTFIEEAQEATELTVEDRINR